MHVHVFYNIAALLSTGVETSINVDTFHQTTFNNMCMYGYNIENFLVFDFRHALELGIIAQQFVLKHFLLYHMGFILLSPI